MDLDSADEATKPELLSSSTVKVAPAAAEQKEKTTELSEEEKWGESSFAAAAAESSSSSSSATQTTVAGSKKSETQDELTELLDSALQDFGKARASEEASKIVEDPPDEDLPPVDPFLDKQMAQQAAAEFQNMLRQLAEVQKVVLEQTKSDTDQIEGAPSGLPPVGSIAAGVAAAGLGPASAPGASGDTAMPDDAAVAEALLQNLQHLAEQAQKVTDAGSEDEFVNAMEEMQTNTAYENDFLPFMQNLMGSLLSKDMMYPSLKEMEEKYPTWLEEKKGTLSAEDSERYSKQLSLIHKACQIYESEQDDDPPEVRGKRFEELIQVMQQMQLCGQPPEELIGNMPPGWGLDEATGLPQVVDSQAAADSCSVM